MRFILVRGLKDKLTFERVFRQIIIFLKLVFLYNIANLRSPRHGNKVRNTVYQKVGFENFLVSKNMIPLEDGKLK